MRSNNKKELSLFPAYWYWESAIPEYLIQCIDEECKYITFGKGSTFPQVICDDKKIGGCTDTVNYLKENQIV